MAWWAFSAATKVGGESAAFAGNRSGIVFQRLLGARDANSSSVLTTFVDTATPRMASMSPRVTGC